MKLYRVEDGAAVYWMTLALGTAEEARDLMCATVGESPCDYDSSSWRVSEMTEDEGCAVQIGCFNAWELHMAAECDEPTCHGCTEWDRMGPGRRRRMTTHDFRPGDVVEFYYNPIRDILKDTPYREVITGVGVSHVFVRQGLFGGLGVPVSALTLITRAPDVAPTEHPSRSRAASSLRADPVDHPAHYTDHPSGVECITVTEHMNFNVGNAVKYLWRAGRKGDALTDLRKAAWYVNREIERLTREGGS